MANFIFYCPECAFRKEISKSNIPPTAKKCICPSCRKILNISDSIVALNTEDVEICPQTEISPVPPREVEEETNLKTDKHQSLVDMALTKLKEKDDLEAMALLEEAERINSTPKTLSYLAYCRAKIKYEFSDAISLCAHCINEEPNDADHYLNLARIYLLANKRRSALQTIRKGLKLGPHPELMKEYRKFDRRNPLLFSSLPREHFLNKGLGKMFYRLGFR